MLISGCAFVVKRGGGRLRGQQEEGPFDPRGGRDEGVASHFFAPLDDLPSVAIVAADCADGSISVALSLRIDRPSSSSR